MLSTFPPVFWFQTPAEVLDNCIHVQVATKTFLAVVTTQKVTLVFVNWIVVVVVLVAHTVVQRWTFPCYFSFCCWLTWSPNRPRPGTILWLETMKRAEQRPEWAANMRVEAAWAYVCVWVYGALCKDKTPPTSRAALCNNSFGPDITTLSYEKWNVYVNEMLWVNILTRTSGQNICFCTHFIGIIWNTRRQQCGILIDAAFTQSDDCVNANGIQILLRKQQTMKTSQQVLARFFLEISIIFKIVALTKTYKEFLPRSQLLCVFVPRCTM